MPAAQSPEFKKACEESRKLKLSKGNKEDQAHLLQLYALFTVGCDTKQPALTKEEEKQPGKEARPGALSFEGRYKWDAWKEEFTSGTEPAEAQKKYVALVEKLKAEKGMQA